MPNSLQNADYIFSSKTIPSEPPASLGNTRPTGLRFVRGSLCVSLRIRLSVVLRVSPALPHEAIALRGVR
jgi:hypothetical protein